MGRELIIIIIFQFFFFWDCATKMPLDLKKSLSNVDHAKKTGNGKK